MISLKKYLDMDIGERPADVDPGDLLYVTLESYRTTLRAAGAAGARACPGVSSDFQAALIRLAEVLEGDLTTSVLTETGAHASREICAWGDRAVEYLNAKTAEIKELLVMLARTTASVGERDNRYAGHFNQFTTRLRSISNLDDLTQIRASLVQQAAELKTYVDHMQEESHKLVATLQTEVNAYETKLKEVEELALRDPLTGLSNRRNMEERIETRIKRGQTFCVVMLDLNQFKQVNDQHGHIAGDILLQQFAQELRSSMRSSDVVGRWGGDEFLLVLDADAAGARAQVGRLQKWVFGNYTIRPGKGSQEVKVNAHAAIGVAEWRPGEGLTVLVDRADDEMYKHKQQIRAGGA
ncbi:MAG: GGDEF domain-containing protein [Acidobacteriaceae bacterium]|nr:GGDEF domain-containing protein [Acidobacteriaceae bacterium]